MFQVILVGETTWGFSVNPGMVNAPLGCAKTGKIDRKQLLQFDTNSTNCPQMALPKNFWFWNPHFRMDSWSYLPCSKGSETSISHALQTVNLFLVYALHELSFDCCSISDSCSWVSFPCWQAHVNSCSNCVADPCNKYWSIGGSATQWCFFLYRKTRKNYFYKIT